MSKTFFIVSFVLFSVVLGGAATPHAFADETCSPSAPFCALAPIPGLTTPDAVGTTVNPTSLSTFLNGLYRYILGLAAVAAIVQIMWGGMQMAVNRDSVSKALDGKGRISQAIQGLILVFAPYLIFSVINPAILQLKIAPEPLSVANGPEGNAANHNVQIGEICSSSDQCVTNYCDTTLAQPRCANQPNANGDQCSADPHPPANMACPSTQDCVVNSSNHYVCQVHCEQLGYTIPDEFNTTNSVACPSRQAFTDYCPTGAPDYNECRYNDSLDLAVCLNLSVTTGCLVHDQRIIH